MSWARKLVARVRATWSDLGPRRRRWAVVALAGGLVLVAVLLGLSTGWTISTIGDYADKSSLAVDASGGVHVAYWDPVSPSSSARWVVYASKGLTGWSLTRIYSIPDTDQMVDPTSIAATPDGHAWIAFGYWVGVNNVYSIYAAEMDVATDESGAWVVSTLPGHGVAPSVAVSAAGQAYAAFIGVTAPDSGGNLTVVEHTATGWDPRVLTEVGYGPGPYTQVAVDGSGHVHVAFGNSFSLGYATNATGAWAVTWLNETTSEGLPAWLSGPSMAVDAGGHAHLSVEGEIPGTGVSAVLYLTNAGGPWSTYPLEPLNLAVDTSIAVDGRGAAHVAWYDQENGTLRYATGTEGVWSTQTVGSAVGGQVPLSIGVGPDERVHIAFYGFHGLGYATNQVDASNLGAFLASRALWWVAPALVCGVALFRVIFVRTPRIEPQP